MKWLAIFVAGLVIGGVGFALGRNADSSASLPGSSKQPVASELRAVLAIPDSRSRVGQLVEFFAHRGPDDVAAIRAVMSEARQDVDPIFTGLLADWWAGFDPEAAFKDAARWPIDDMYLGSASVVRAWARDDAAAARAAVEGIEKDEMRRRCVEGLIKGWQESGQEGLIGYIETLPHGTVRQKSLEVFMSRMVNRDGIDATLRFAEAQPDDGTRNFKLQVYRRAVTAVGALDLERASEWALKHAEGPFGDGLLRRLGSAWSFRDPEAAMAWVSELPDVQGRDEAARETFRVWLGQDRERALTWMEGKVPTAGRSLAAAVGLAAAAKARDNPDLGLQWLDQIADPVQREEGMISFAHVLIRADRDKGVRWLADAPISQEAKDRILKARVPRAQRNLQPGHSGARPAPGS